MVDIQRPVGFLNIGPRVNDVPQVNRQGGRTDLVPRCEIESPPVVYKDITEQIAICSPQGEIRHFNPKGLLRKVTVLELKEAVLEIFPGLASSVDDVRLSYQGLPLDVNSALLPDYKLKPHVMIQIMMKVQGG